MTKAVMPDDEHSEYIITQVVADFLSSRLGLDGIMFPSAQSKNGINVTLFHHASRIRDLNYPYKTKVHVNLMSWDGEEEVPEYFVKRQLPMNTNSRVPEDEEVYISSALYSHLLDTDRRVESLSIEIDSITIEHIESIQINRKSHLVEHFISQETGNYLSDF